MNDSGQHGSHPGGKRPGGDPYRTVASGEASDTGSAEECPPGIGRYQIERLLGVGSFGRIYLALDPQLQRRVAIKAPHRHLVARPQDAEPYLREAQALARLDHPHIVPVYDVGSSEAVPFYIVSKYIEGIDLATRMQRERLNYTQISELIAAVAEALHYAHTQGLVHRDIKPANILLEHEMIPCVADFGLALRDEDVGKGPRYAGTPAYMSPEQARGEGHRVDGRSDIYSLGAVMYELLTGRRMFDPDSQAELLEWTACHDPKPPRQINDSLPRELERICLKAVARRASDRYTTAKDLADDLRWFLVQHPAAAGDAAAGPIVPRLASETKDQRRHVTTAADSAPLRVVPKGLRAFGARDADFFLRLLPGPRDRDGLPESIQFWKAKIEETDPELTFPVGLIYGPSGCGKSSFVRAGLLPLVSEQVVVVYVESTARDTEQRLRTGLCKKVPHLPPDQSLNEQLAALRTDSTITGGRKVLLIVDQFEQWLHATDDYENSCLAQALRQCDGRRVQCLLLVRDDFWMAVTRFLQALEIGLVERENSGTIDLLPPRHARRVLAAFGRAFGDLPLETQALSAAQKAFLSRAVDELTEGGHVICIRLTLFAEMIKGKPWVEETLRRAGGAAGAGVTFLEETFSGSTAPPAHRYHQLAARRVLGALLPEPGTGIKGRMRSYDQLLAAAGYDQRPGDFADLLQILDRELRLITPTDPAGAIDTADSEEVARNSPGQRQAQPAEPRYYQLTHDYLISPLREWLTRKQRETQRGRAELRLAERSAQWHRQPENRFLPSLWEDASIRSLTRKRQWSDAERCMMRKSAVFHARRVLAVLLLVILFGWLGFELIGRIQASAMVRQIATAQTDDLPELIDALRRHRRWADPQLIDLAGSEDPHRQWRARLALLPVDSHQVEPLRDRLLVAEPDEVDVLQRALQPYGDQIADRLWETLEQDEIDAQGAAVLPCASTLALYEPDSTRWPDVAARVTTALVSANAVHAPEWIRALEPARHQLLDALAQVHLNREAAFSRTQRDRATDILAIYADGQPELLAELLLEGEPEQFVKLIDRLAACGPPAIELMRTAFEQQPRYSWKDLPLDPSWPDVSATDRSAIEAALGEIRPRFAFCQEMPLARFRQLVGSLGASGYRPLRVRPFRRQDQVLVAATWSRDPWAWHVALDLTAGELQDRDAQQRAQGLHVIDVAGYLQQVDGVPTNRYCAVWMTLRPEDHETRLFTGGTIYGFEKTVERIDRQGFTEMVSSQAFEHQDGHQELCGVRADDGFWFERIYDRSSQEYGRMEYLSMTQVNVDVSSAPLQSIEDRLRQDLANAEERLAVFTEDRGMLAVRAKALFWMKRYAESIADLDRIIANIEEPREKLPWISLRARAQARLGKPEAAQADLELCRKLNSSDVDMLLTETLVTASLGDVADALAQLESQIADHMDSNQHLHYGAMIYSLVSEMVAQQDAPSAARYAARANELLERAFDNGFAAYLYVVYQPEFAPIRDTPKFQELLAPGLLELRYAAIWRASPTDVATEAHDLDPAVHLEACQEFAAADYRPLVVSVAYLPDAEKTIAASVWLQPRVTEEEGDAFARRQANAALALLRLGAHEQVWSILRHSENPSARSYVIDRCSQAGVVPSILVDQLRREEDISVRRALVQCLGGYTSIPHAIRDSLSGLLSKMYVETNDAGLHAAIEYAYRRWGREEELAKMDEPVSWEEALEGRGWFHTSLEQKMVVVPGPVEYLMGSACTGRKTDILASRHHRTIPRSFAISAKEVTVEQFHRFLQDVPGYNHFYGKGYSPEKSCPQCSINWYDAAAFCRWLSEQEGIPEDQMCYPPIPQIGPDLKIVLPANSIERTGYRLPTEAEWEYACGAQSTVNRPFGISDRLLDRYAWYAVNSQDRTWPVGRLLPNDFGLFDMLGNLEEWCHDPYRKFSFRQKPNAAIDRQPNPVNISPTQGNITRGGSWSSTSLTIDTSLRAVNSLNTRDSELGFRLARTIPAD